jgi:ABC-2 type transport system ATP-binding protein
VTGRFVQLPAHDALEVERILARVREAGVPVEDIEITKADLEDVFLDLTGSRKPVPVATNDSETVA